MSGSPGPDKASAQGRREGAILLAVGILCLAPLAAYHAMFARLFWFGDEYQLIDQIDRLGFWSWLWRAFAENFVPLFKVLWGGSVLLFHGSYAAMVLLVWLTHALNVFLFGRVMRAFRLDWMATLFSMVFFGLTSGNLETLAWTVQWSAVLSITFLLLGLELLVRRPFSLSGVLCSAASALSFSRGVLTGPLLAFGSLLPGMEVRAVSVRRRFIFRAACLLAAALVALLIALLAKGNHHHMRGHFWDAAAFGAWYYCMNPAHSLLSVESVGWHTVAVLGLGKVALAVWAIARSQGRIRTLFVLLVAFDLGNAVLLGIGRFHTGYLASISSRYQYASLIGILPLAGQGVAALWQRLPGGPSVRRAMAVAVLGMCAVFMCRNWADVLDPFTIWRGSDSRRELVEKSEPGPVPGIPGMTRERARELIRRFNLH
jgi:hypothetical protein